MSFLSSAAGIALIEAGADAAGMHEVIAAVDADEQRAQVVGAAAPAADHHLLAAAALGLVPALGAPGLVRRAGALGDDAFEIEIAGRLEHRIAGLGEVLDILDVAGMRSLAAQQLPEPLLALGQRQLPQILAALEQQVEHEVGQIPRAAFGERRLQRGEIRCAVVVEGDHLAIDDAVRQAARRHRRSAANLSVQSRPLRVRITASPSSTRSCMR